MSLKTYTIFLASSNELSDDRTNFSDIESQLNKLMVQQQRNVRFSIYKFEHDKVSFADRRKQDVYNENINSCHIFIMLYGSKVGEYTEEEFNFAYQKFRDSGYPQVLVFKKSDMPPANDSVQNFEQKIKVLHQQFRPYYKVVDDLNNIIVAEINRYFAERILKDGVAAKTLYNDGQSVPSNFIGRKGELKEIQNRLNKGGKLMLINAEGGIGKTTLAAKYWQESVYDYEYNAWLFCENGIIEALKKLAPALELDLSNKTEEAQIDMLKQKLGNMSDDFLLVLDNADREGDIEEFMQTFNNCRWHVLITSRQTGVLSNPDDEYHIDHLPPDVAKRLFLSIYEEATPKFDELLDEFLAGIGYHTLLIEMFSKYMRELHVLGENFAYMLKQLEEKGLFLEDRSLEVHMGYNRKQKAKTDDIINTLYDLSKLKEEERYYLVNMALLPAIPHEFSFLCELFQQDRFQFTVLKELAKQGWLTLSGSTYRVSPVVQKIVIAKNKERLEEDSNELIKLLIKKLDNDGTHMTLGRHAGQYGIIAQSILLQMATVTTYNLSILAHNVCVYCLSIGQTKEAMDAALYLRSVSILLGYEYNVAVACQMAGTIYRKMGQLDKTLEFYRECHKIKKELYESDLEDIDYKEGLAIACHYLGKIYEETGNIDEAFELYKEFYVLEKELYETELDNIGYKNNLAIACQNLGSIHSANGELDKAQEFYDEYNTLEKELYASHPQNLTYKRNLAVSCQFLGIIYDKKGEPNKALEFYNENYRLEKELHESNPKDVVYKNGLAIACQYLGNFYSEINDIEKALKFYSEYNTIKKELHENNPGIVEYAYGMGLSLTKLGDMAILQKRNMDAKEYYMKACQIFRTLISEHPESLNYQNALAYAQKRLSKLENK